MNSDWRTWRWENLFSLRVWFGALLLGGILGALVAMLAEPLGMAVFVIVAGWVLYFNLASPTQVLYCPYCRKRVKAGATTCHHCSRVVV